MPKIKITKREEKSLFKIYKPRNKTQKNLILREYKKQLNKHTKKYHTKSPSRSRRYRTARRRSPSLRRRRGEYETARRRTPSSRRRRGEYETARRRTPSLRRIRDYETARRRSPIRRRRRHRAKSPDSYSASITPPRRRGTAKRRRHRNKSPTSASITPPKRRRNYTENSAANKTNEAHITNQLKTALKSIKNMTKLKLKPILMDNSKGNCIINVNRLDAAYNVSIDLSVLCSRANFQIIKKTADAFNSLLTSIGQPKFTIKDYEKNDMFKSLFMYNNSNKGGIGVVRAVKQPNDVILLILVVELFIPREDGNLVDDIPEGINKILKKIHQKSMNIEL